MPFIKQVSTAVKYTRRMDTYWSSSYGTPSTSARIETETRGVEEKTKLSRKTLDLKERQISNS
jgi:hypothetical protein